jgi:4a-hydroxytetrahydrobiopterin dehydratase
MKKYNTSEIKLLLEKLENWKLIDNAIERNFVFKDFSESLAFIVRVGIVAEKANHHPEVYNVYNKVKLRLSTHDSDGITQKDFDLASKIDGL